MRVRTFKKMTAIVAAAALFLSAGGSGVFAANQGDNDAEWSAEWNEVPSYADSGQCGNNITWNLNKETGLLKINGSGAMWSRNDHESSFWNHSYVKSVEISGNITSIGDNAFDHCNAMQELTLPDTVTKIGTEAFFYCSFTKINLPLSLKIIGNRAFFCNRLNELTLPQGLSTIAEQAFFSSKNLTEVTIPKSVTSLAANAFGDCQKLTRITVEKGNTEFSDDNGVLLNADQTELLSCPAGRTETYVVPSTVTAIHSAAFYTCYNLQGIVLPKKLKTIGNAAFSYCASVEAMEVPPSVTSIGSNAFQSCRLKALVMSPTLQSVGKNCFADAFIDHFYFRGSWEEWDAISGTSNSRLSSTNAEYHFNCTDRIIIYHQPMRISTTVGLNASFSVYALGDGLNYQWYYKKKDAADWSKWNGHTGYLTSGRANLSWDGMQLRCKVTDSAGNTVWSDACTLSVNEVIHINQQPQNVTTFAGKTVSFAVDAEITGDTSHTLLYQWYYKKKGAKNWSKWNGHTTATTSAVANESWNGMQVYCEVWGDVFWANACPTATATITISDSVVITSQPSNVTAAVGGTVKFTVKAQGDGLKYQWYYKKKGATAWSLWKGHTTATTSATVNATWDGIQLYCAITDPNGCTVQSDAATVTLSPIKITSQPQNVTAKEGDTVKFTVKAEGSGLKYQWYYKKKGAIAWSLWKGHTTATTSATVNSTWNGIQLYCLLTDADGNTLSSGTATVTFG